MIEHSPTPWAHNIESIWAGDQHVARLDGSHDLTTANGDIIVYAVSAHSEMVEALKAAEKLLRRQNEVLGPTASNNLCLSKIRSALAKATPATLTEAER